MGRLFTTKTFLLLLLMLPFSISAQNFSNAKEYSDYILTEQAKVINSNISYISKSIHDHKAHQNDAERKNILNHLDEAISRVDNLTDFNGDNSLKEAALEVFNLYKKSYSLDLKEADLLEINARSNYESIKKYFDAQNLAETKLVEAGKKFIKTQKTFAKKHNLEKSLRGDGMCMFTKIAEVNAYSRQIYLEYVGLADINKDFFDAMKKKQGVSMENNRKALLVMAEKSITNLNSVTHFEGDRELLDKGLSLANHLREVASKDYVELININNNKTSTFDDANKFKKIVVSHHKTSKSLIEEFNQASASLMQKKVFHESNQTLAAQSKKDMEKALGQINIDSFQKELAYEPVASSRILFE